MSILRWYSHHLKFVLKRQLRVLRNEGITTFLKDTSQIGWTGFLSSVGKLTDGGVSVWDAGEWDILIILDACRVDALCAVANEYDFLPDESSITEIKSVGSCTPEWLNSTFAAKYSNRLQQTGYVTANPHSKSNHGAYEALPLSDDVLGLLAEVWRTDWQGEGTTTVPPNSVTDHGISIWRNREELNLNKIILHYMQPHEPYRSLNETITQHPDNVTLGAADVGREEGLRVENLWEKIRRGKLDQDEVWEAYIDNLRWVLDDIELLLKNMCGQVVITADHGEAFGEWGIYGHPTGTPVPVVRRVPWIEIEANDDRTHEPEYEIETSQPVSEREVSERLKALGYKG